MIYFGESSMAAEKNVCSAGVKWNILLTSIIWSAVSFNSEVSLFFFIWMTYL
jgi:hypothetical protein